MDSLFMVLFLLSIGALIVGLIGPATVVRWGTTKTRKQVLLYYGTAVVASFVLFGITTPRNNQPTNTPQQTSQKKPMSYSQLEITDISVKDGNVIVKGATDLPDNSVINIDFDLVNRPDNATYIGSSVNTSTINGNFSAKLPIPQRQEFAHGPYLFSATFTPKKQNAQIQSLVGKNGERLSGNLAIKDNGFSVLEVEVKKDLQLQIRPPVYVFQTPEQFKQGTPEYTLSQYVLAWKEARWNDMAKYAQVTWQNEQSDPASVLKNWYGLKSLKGFQVISSSKVSDCVQDITFTVKYSIGDTNNFVTEQLKARILKESAPYTPSVQGQWGINPVSMLSGQILQGN